MSPRQPPPGDSAAVARRHAPEAVTAGHERPIEVDQTNCSVVVDEAVIVKWLNEPVPAPHPATVVLEHLHAVGFDAVPRLWGAEVVEGQVVALVFEHVAGARDGWEWFVDEVAASFDGSDVTSAASSAVELSALTARLHAALATASTVIPHPTAPVATGAEWDRGDELLQQASRVASGWPGEVLATRVGTIAAMLDAAPRCMVPGLRVHGDLHVGQFLRAGERLVVIDFEGNPLLDQEHHGVLRSPMVDLASLVQSLDHACRVVERRRQAEPGALDRVAEGLRAGAVSSYREAIADLGHVELFDEALLEPLCVVQELHELVYASTHLPHWAEVTARTLNALVDPEHST